MSKAPATFDVVVHEGSTAVYSSDLKDDQGTDIGSGAIQSLSLTLTNVDDGSILNGRNEQDVLNTNNVTISGTGALVWTLQPGDTDIVDSLQTFETHRATFQMNFNGTSYLNWDVDILVRNLTGVT